MMDICNHIALSCPCACAFMHQAFPIIVHESHAHVSLNTIRRRSPGTERSELYHIIMIIQFECIVHYPSTSSQRPVHVGYKKLARDAQLNMKDNVKTKACVMGIISFARYIQSLIINVRISNFGSLFDSISTHYMCDPSDIVARITHPPTLSR